MSETLPVGCRVEAWDPHIAGITEVLHARIVGFCYPMHSHDTWTVVIIDDGEICYDLDRRRCGASGAIVAVLPPGIIHNGRSADRSSAFQKRNLYLDGSFFPATLVGAGVDHTNVHDRQLRAALSGLHRVLVRGGDGMDGEARLAIIGDRLLTHLLPRAAVPRSPERASAVGLRDVLHAHIFEPITLKEAATELNRSVPHLVRSFTAAFGVSPHAYLIGQRIEASRRLLLAGGRPAEVAHAVGFFDQAHFTRHFKRHTSTSPARYASSHARALPHRPD